MCIKTYYIIVTAITSTYTTNEICKLSDCFINSQLYLIHNKMFVYEPIAAKHTVRLGVSDTVMSTTSTEMFIC